LRQRDQLVLGQRERKETPHEDQRWISEDFQTPGGKKGPGRDKKRELEKIEKRGGNGHEQKRGKS